MSMDEISGEEKQVEEVQNKESQLSGVYPCKINKETESEDGPPMNKFRKEDMTQQRSKR